MHCAGVVRPLVVFTLVDAGLLEEYGKKGFVAILMCSRVRSRPLTPFFDPTLVGVCLDSHLLAVRLLDRTT